MSVINQHQLINRPTYAPCASTGNSFYPTSNFNSSSSNSYKPYPSNAFTCSEQLRIRIHENHLSYLSRDETPSKFELRNKIEILITEYLSLIPHSHKFSFKEVAECLNKSIKRIDFDPQKAIWAFEAVERYATNLLNFPWRHEFRTIFAFSGFFYRVVECVLVDFEPIFELLGFAYDSSSHIFKLIEVPIDPDKVSQISLECLVAIVECKTMLNIYNLAKAKYSDISWSDIYSIRNDYICNTENAVKLICDLRSTGKLIDLDLPDYSVKKFNKIDLLSPSSSMNKPIVHDSTIVPPPASYLLESNLDSIDFIDSSNFEKKENTSIAKLFPANSNSHHTNSSSQDSSATFKHYSSKPLLDKKFSDDSLNQFVSKSDLQSTVTCPNSAAANFINENAKDTKYREIDPVLLAEINQFEANRKNVSSSNATAKGIAFPNNSFERKFSIKKVAINENKANERIGHVQIVNYYPKNAKIERLLDNPTFPSINSTTVNQSQMIVQTSPSSSSFSSNKAPDHTLMAAATQQPETNASAIWICKSCTYKNRHSRDICQICHKSRTQGNEAIPLMSGGRECNRCTLVNSKNEEFCKACQTSLADSPTYI